MHFAAVFHDLLARTIDHPRPGARIRSLWEREPCPRCGSPERAEFGPFEPNRLVTVDVAPVTHDAWAALPTAEKRDIALEVVRDCALRAIERAVHRETEAWDTQDVDTLVRAVFHPDMVWPWPPDSGAHDPVSWVIPWGRYNEQRWRARWAELFETHELVHNRRVIRRIEASREGDGGFAVVDVDTLWRHRSGAESHWLGRACKIYTLVQSRWLMIAQTGLLEYP